MQNFNVLSPGLCFDESFGECMDAFNLVNSGFASIWFRFEMRSDEHVRN